jgi:hypothetical protein
MWPSQQAIELLWKLAAQRRAQVRAERLQVPKAWKLGFDERNGQFTKQSNGSARPWKLNSYLERLPIFAIRLHIIQKAIPTFP